MLTKMWSLLDTPMDEQRKFDHVTSLVSSSMDEVSGDGCLALEVIDQVIIVNMSLSFAFKSRESVYMICSMVVFLLS